MGKLHVLRESEVEAKSEIENAIYGFMRAFEAKDLNAIIACYAPEIVAFDMMPPLQYSGIKAWRDLWKKSMDMMKGDIKAEITDLDIDVSGELAVCHGLNHVVMKGQKSEDNVDMWFRWSASFRKINGKWLVTHEHTSVPGDMESGKMRMDLKP